MADLDGAHEQEYLAKLNKLKPLIPKNRYCYDDIKCLQDKYFFAMTNMIRSRAHW